MVEWVAQEHENGCVIASLSMVTGMTYKQVQQSFKVKVERGVHDDETDAWLAEHGFAVARKERRYKPGKCNRSPWPPAPFADLHLVVVKEDDYHMVVMLRDGTVLDPATPGSWRLTDYGSVMWVAAVVSIQ